MGLVTVFNGIFPSAVFIYPLTSNKSYVLFQEAIHNKLFN